MQRPLESHQGLPRALAAGGFLQDARPEVYGGKNGLLCWELSKIAEWSSHWEYQRSWDRSSPAKGHDQLHESREQNTFWAWSLAWGQLRRWALHSRRAPNFVLLRSKLESASKEGQIVRSKCGKRELWALADGLQARALKTTEKGRREPLDEERKYWYG